jgi:hypothetical protein
MNVSHSTFQRKRGWRERWGERWGERGEREREMEIKLPIKVGDCVVIPFHFVLRLRTTTNINGIGGLQ